MTDWVERDGGRRQEQCGFSFQSPLVQSLYDMQRPGGVWEVSKDTEVKWMQRTKVREPDIHDVVTWDWPARAFEHYFREVSAHEMYTNRLRIAGWINWDGEVTW